MYTHRTSLAVLMATIMVLTGCSTAQVIANLQIALDAVTVALPILASVTGVPADTVTTVDAYVTATNTALGQASTILAGAGTDAEKAAQITAAFAAIAKPVVPSQYAAIAQLVETLASDVATFLASVPGTGIALQMRAAGGVRTTAWSGHDREVLAHCTSTANANTVALAKLPRK